MVDTSTITVIVALGGPLLGYIAAARKMSGQIKNSEATELWEESRSIREWSALRIKELDEHVLELERRVHECEKSSGELAIENRKLNQEVYKLRNRIQLLQDEKSTLTRLLSQERELTKQLQEDSNA